MTSAPITMEDDGQRRDDQLGHHADLPRERVPEHAAERDAERYAYGSHAAVIAAVDCARPRWRTTAAG